MSPRIARVSAFGLLLLIGLTTPSSAQSIFQRAADAAKRKAAEKAREKATEKSADSAAAQKAAKADDEANKVNKNESQPVLVPPTPAPGGLWLNFDFKRGKVPVYKSENFKDDDVGSFPQGLDFVEGNMEVADLAGTRFLRLSSSTGSFKIVLPDSLPEHFTLDFQFMPTPGYGQEIRFTGDKPASQPPFGVVTIECYEPKQCDGGIRTNPAWTKAVAPDAETHQIIHVAIKADGKYGKVYLNGTRVANVPNADFGRSKQIVFDLHGDAKNATLIGDINVNVGVEQLYHTLAANKRVATQGIYFEPGSDQIKPESGPTLKEIAAMLADHTSLKLTIEGHTDNQGKADDNLALSEKRAAAVKQALVTSFGVDDSRLSTKGLGASKPAQSNATPIGRQLNRRVELVIP